MENNNCPNCGSAEYIGPTIHDTNAYLLRVRSNSGTITVTCVYCKSKFQREASINMAADEPRPEPFVEAVKTVTEPEDKASKLKLRMIGLLFNILRLPFLLFSFITICATIKYMTLRALLFMVPTVGLTVYLVIVTNNYEQRLRKKLKNQHS